MKLRHPWLIRLAAFLAAWLIRWWMSTLRYRRYPHAGQMHPTDPRQRRYIYVFWHETLLAPSHFAAGRIHVLISQHADGELIARVCRHLGIGTVRGSTTRGGAEALLQLIRTSERAHLAVTPDGPRGPRRQVQLGLIFLAAQTGLPIVPVGVGYTRAWRARSWDRFAVPWPYSTAVMVGGAPIEVPARLNRAELERYRTLVEEQMLRVTALAEGRAAGRMDEQPTPTPTGTGREAA